MGQAESPAQRGAGEGQDHTATPTHPILRSESPPVCLPLTENTPWGHRQSPGNPRGHSHPQTHSLPRVMTDPAGGRPTLCSPFWDRGVSLSQLWGNLPGSAWWGPSWRSEGPVTPLTSAFSAFLAEQAGSLTHSFSLPPLQGGGTEDGLGSPAKEGTVQTPNPGLQGGPRETSLISSDPKERRLEHRQKLQGDEAVTQWVPHTCKQPLERMGGRGHQGHHL